MSGGCKRIGVQESADFGVIISALEVVQPGFGIVDVATVAQGVQDAEGGSEVAGGGEGVTPGVVGVGDDGCAAGAQDGSYITLQVRHIVVGCAVQGNGERPPGSVVGKGQGVAAYGHLAEGAAVFDNVFRRAPFPTLYLLCLFVGITNSKILLI